MDTETSKENKKSLRDNLKWLLTCRVALVIISFLGFANLYAQRVNISVAMVCMVNQTALILDLDLVDQGHVINSTDVNLEWSNATRKKTCDSIFAEEKNNTLNVKKEGEFVWSKSTQGLILGSFFWGYMITQFPGGWLSSKFGGKMIFGWSMFVCAIATLMGPVAARVHPVFLMVLRFIVGMCQGVVWPTMHAMWAFWAPPLERSKLIGFSFAGAHFGTVITFPIAGSLCDHGFAGGWPSTFYVFGMLGVVWFVFWMFIVYDTPESHPRIKPEEKTYIQESLAGQTGILFNKHAKVPWLDLIKSKAVLAILVVHTCGAWIMFSFITTIPTYIREVLKFDIGKNGLVSSIPFIGMWTLSMVSGMIADWMRTKEYLSTTNVRKLFTSLGMFIPALICIILGYLDCYHWLSAMILLSIAATSLGCLFSGGFSVNHADIAPQYSSILFGLSNTFGCIPGFTAPYVIGVLTSNQNQEEWRVFFFITAAITSFGALVYLFLASGEPEPWSLMDAKSALERQTSSHSQTHDVTLLAMKQNIASVVDTNTV